ncbi:L,D-transpeptidase [Chondromyces crocatus]|uniref:Piccolo protein n=1 Tax=Chondromyces crocatus TaxID=52 RepID=A0A0K1EAB8_CHOCO|nr:L,D-transpeptidase [Chondromyces crocatus]AKT37826.1 Piccolo protein [Chondromyces crocatus]
MSLRSVVVLLPFVPAFACGSALEGEGGAVAPRTARVAKVEPAGATEGAAVEGVRGAVASSSQAGERSSDVGGGAGGAAERTGDEATSAGHQATPRSEEREASTGTPAAAPVDDRPRLTSQGYVTWIWPTPARGDKYLGYVRNGGSVALRSTEAVRGQGCPGGYLPVEPRGYVCVDRTVTLAPASRSVAIAEATQGKVGAFPYRYALSNGAPMYNRIPSRAEQARFEAKFGKVGSFRPLPKTLSGHEALAVVEPIPATDGLPEFLSGGQGLSDRMGLVRQDIPLGSMVSFTRVFEAEGRAWLMSADNTLVPADRVRPFKPSTFQGVRLGGEVKLPIAWFRKEARPRWRATAGGGLEAAGGSFEVRTFVQLTGQRVERGGRVFLETRERDAGGAALFVAEDDATVVEAREKLPGGVAEGQKWIHVRVTQGTLTAYVGNTPVFATLMSPGAGGVSVPGRDPVKDSTTPRGTFYVTFKDRAATMSPEKGENRSFWIADVPHTQYFNPPFALHAAYWHERFGEPTSAGCVNVSPIDAEWLFGWSDPQVPEGWQGVTGAGATKENGPTTAIVVHR